MRYRKRKACPVKEGQNGPPSSNYVIREELFLCKGRDTETDTDTDTDAEKRREEKRREEIW